MRAHISKATKAKCVEKKVVVCVIPGGLTPYLQAGDIGVYSSFKAKLSEFINTWKLSDDVQYTRGRNVFRRARGVVGAECVGSCT
ncbi:hypothetical protein PC116_g13001 [Phytophthora cactorum]|uniref:Uncharacterized protein n=1 Tax=Phytophthora cactorum TaxID=29920 RepID=A0A8T1KU70_9STRA|nr:hypothetical protein Pcac1_g5346 [Phytophthora cactorum]KAG2908345.1 hypothetical protein PC114_g10504 [Phytophthora cactorum]KAG2941349.1 hypothetical protein PC117_g10256 [Phytophthora cactorum]KAG3019698.1 hypothetical protein PC120_g9731 [Phytophthora cactorum]KAG3170346.1 hypothetical protein C6341_g10826 [Phytophthora cactorum]